MDQHPRDARRRRHRGSGARIYQTSKDRRKMNRKQLLIILLVGIVLGGIGLYLNKKKSASFERTEKISTGKLLGDFPVNDVAQMTIRQYTNEVNLAKADAWSVKERGNYPANAGEIIEFARKLWDLRSALLGKKSMRGGGDDAFGGGGWPNGRWVYLPDKRGTAYLVSETFNEIE